MKGLKYGFGLILVGGFALTASCGGSSSDDSSTSSTAGTTSSTAGSSSSSGGGTGTGGTHSGTAGSGTGTAGTGITGTGGSGNGTAGGTTTGTGGTATGTGGTGTGGTTTGTAGRTGTGGAPTNPAGCPATGKTGDMCTPAMNGRETCDYAATNPGEETTCTCTAPRVGRGPGGGQAGAADTADGTLTCATGCAARTSTPPATGDACSLPNRSNCAFGTLQAGLTNCTCTNMKWTCRDFMIGAGGAG